MIHNIPLVLLGDDGTILNAIESQRGRVSVARSAHTFADALGYAHAGIACAILSVGLPQEATVSILHELDEADVKFIALVPEDTPLPDLVMPLATDTEPHQLPAVVEKLLDEASAEPEQELGITPQKAENGMGTTRDIPDTTDMIRRISTTGQENTCIPILLDTAML